MTVRGFIFIGVCAIFLSAYSSPEKSIKLSEIKISDDFKIEYVDVNKIINSSYSIVKSNFKWDLNKSVLLDCDKERDDDRVVLACNIYHESRNQPIKGQEAIGLVTRNRVKSEVFPTSYSSVVWQIKRRPDTNKRIAQFSWALDGKPDKVRDPKAWVIAWNIANDVIDGKVHDFTNGSLWYHTIDIKPAWTKNLTVELILENHVFYS